MVSLAALAAKVASRGVAAPRRTRSPSRLVTAGAIAIAVALTSSAAAASAAAATLSRGHPTVPCARSAAGTTTIAHSRRARLFTDARTGNDYACLYGVGHPRLLSSAEHWEYELVRFAGPYVAFVAFAESTNAYIGVLDIRSGKRRRIAEDEEVAAVKPPRRDCPSAVPNCSVVCPAVDSLVLKPDGAVAWIGVDFPPPTTSGGAPCGAEIPTSTEVRRYDSRGLDVVATGDGIEPTSLRLSGSTISWTDEGVSESSSLR